MGVVTENGAGNGSIQGRVIAEMRRRIIAGQIEPGVNLSELALAEEFGVSRTPVREALKQLQTEGLVEIRPRVGTFVTTPSRRDWPSFCGIPPPIARSSTRPPRASSARSTRLPARQRECSPTPARGRKCESSC